MRTRTNRALVATLALMLGVSTAALAAGPLKGKTYEGAAPATGTSNFHHFHMKLRAGGKVILKVSGNGKSVTVHFTSSYPVFYCNIEELLKVQTTTPARISGSGTFRAYIGQRFIAGPGDPAITQVVSGRFSGGTVSGTIKTENPECGGVSSFSAQS